jgi:hypothetical protein
MWWKTMLLIVLALLVVVVAVLFYGNARWNAGTKELRARLEAARVSTEPKFFAASELEGLPAPVKRYFQAVLKEGQPIVAAVTIQHRGTFNMSETADQWKPFTSTQRVVTQRPGFDWDARVLMMPGLPVHVHDAYIAGEGLLHAAVLGLVSMVNQRGTEALARGELMRFFAEAAWYPTAMLPSQGVRWDAVDDRSARATLSDGKLTLMLLFHFQEDGLIDTVLAEARDRILDGKTVTAPWQCRFWNYAIRDGMRVPLDGEVAWLTPEGRKLYYRGRSTSVAYEFAK